METMARKHPKGELKGAPRRQQEDPAAGVVRKSLVSSVEHPTSMHSYRTKYFFLQFSTYKLTNVSFDNLRYA